MPTISVFPDDPHAPDTHYRAASGTTEAVGPTVGQAVDALTAQIGPFQGTTLIVVQTFQPDPWFPADRRDRLEHLMIRWRTARDSGQPFPPADQQELDSLIQEELAAAARRSEALLSTVGP